MDHVSVFKWKLRAYLLTVTNIEKSIIQFCSNALLKGTKFYTGRGTEYTN